MSADAPPPEAWTTRDDLRAVYQAVCTSYHAIDDFRMKLLALLPVATGTGVFLLLSGKSELLGQGGEGVPEAMAAIGAVGLLFTLGLFAFEIYGIKKCHYLIEAGRRLERDIGVRGQFRTRPFDAAGFLNEPVASALIYPSSMAAWLFLGIGFYSLAAAAVLAVVVALGGCYATARYLRKFAATHDVEELILQKLRDEAGGTTVEDLAATLRRAEEARGRVADTKHKDPGEAFVHAALQRLQGRGDVDYDGTTGSIARRHLRASALDRPATNWRPPGPATPDTDGAATPEQVPPR